MGKCIANLSRFSCTIKIFAFITICVTLLDKTIAENSFCSFSDDGSVGIEALSRIISNERCNVKSADDLLGLLPKSMRSRFVLIYRSQSLQGPRTPDFQNPRVILSSSYDRKLKKRLYLSFNGKPTQANHNNIEVLEIDATVPSSSEDIFRYFDIKFPSDKSSKAMKWESAHQQIVVSGPNPEKCVACHGHPAKPIFQSYPIWHGVYGSFHLTINPKEKVELARFIENSRQNEDSRYRHLVFSDDYSAFYGDKNFGILTGQNNVEFNISLSVPNMQRVARAAQKTTDYRHYRAAMLGALLDCSDFMDFFTPTKRAAIDRNLESLLRLDQIYDKAKSETLLREFFNLGENQFGYMIEIVRKKLGLQMDDAVSWQDFSTTHLNLWNKSLTMNRLWLDTIERQGHHRADKGIAQIRYVMEGRNIDISNWFIDIKQPTYRMSDGFQWSEGLAWAIINEDAELEKFRNLAKKSNFLGSDYDASNGNSEAEEFRTQLCSNLRSESLNTMKSAPEVNTSYVNNFTEIVQKGEFPKTFINTCARCHTSQTIGPTIPFLDATHFKAWYLDGDNRDKIYYRLTTKDPLDSMPLDDHLEEDELANILQYLKDLKK